MIREITTLIELDKVVKLGNEFYEEAGFPSEINPQIFAKNWLDYLVSGTGVIFGIFDGDILKGMIGGVVYNEINDGILTAMELFWYLDRDVRGNGIKLLYRFQDWAKAKSAKHIVMKHLNNLMPEKVADIYLKLGYKPVETSYLKVV